MRRLVAFWFLIIFSALLLFFWLVRPSFFPDRNPILVQIAKGSTVHQIAEELKQKGVIRSPAFFIFLARVSGIYKSFRHGTYLLERNHYWDIQRKLREGLFYKIKVTLPEGWTTWQVGERLKALRLISDEEAFLKAVRDSHAEGTLFPETYFFELESGTSAIIQAMVGQFRRNFPEEWRKRAGELKMTERDAVILASIIEREAKADSERAVISSVYHNRMKKKWLLESCPTVQYALSGGRYWKEKVTYRDLKVNSPYNTYLHRGLPPGPICSPGKKSLYAALYPAETPFFFFMADGQGRHDFFTSYKEHLKKKLQIKKEGS